MASFLLTKFDEGVGPGHCGDLLSMLLMKLCLKVFQVSEGQLLGKAGFTQHKVAHSFLYTIAAREKNISMQVRASFLHNCFQIVKKTWR